MSQTRSSGDNQNPEADIKATRLVLVAEVYELMKIMLNIQKTINDQNREITYNGRKMDNYININEEKIGELVKRFNTIESTSMHTDITPLRAMIIENNQHSNTNERTGIIDEIFDRVFAKIDEILTGLERIDSMLTGNTETQEVIQRNDDTRAENLNIQKGKIAVELSEHYDDDSDLEKIEVIRNAEECTVVSDDLKVGVKELEYEICDGKEKCIDFMKDMDMSIGKCRERRELKTVNINCDEKIELYHKNGQNIVDVFTNIFYSYNCKKIIKRSVNYLKKKRTCNNSAKNYEIPNKNVEKLPFMQRKVHFIPNIRMLLCMQPKVHDGPNKFLILHMRKDYSNEMLSYLDFAVFIHIIRILNYKRRRIKIVEYFKKATETD